MKCVSYYEFPIGTLGIAEDGKGITDIFLVDGERDIVSGEREKDRDKGFDKECETELICACREQLEEYFRGERRVFELPLSLHGTDFQVRDWEALCTIPYGETRSYQEIAVQIGSPKGCRAVGMANHKNPVLIVVPCHRVIGKNGKLVGYGGGLDVKEFLLKLEKHADCGKHCSNTL